MRKVKRMTEPKKPPLECPAFMDNEKCLDWLAVNAPGEHYLDIDDDEESQLGAAVFKDEIGMSITDILDEDDGM